MILVDFSSIIHRMIFGSVSAIKPNKIDGELVTEEFIHVTKFFILRELISIQKTHKNKFGDLVICLDNTSNGNWRKDVYSGYKASRKKGRDQSEINYEKVFKHIDEFVNQIRDNLPIKVVSVDRTEADDLMLVLAHIYNNQELILIHSPDKDLIQAQYNNDTVFQYSALTNKWMVPENKHSSMEHWIHEHICLGDAADDIPKIVDHTEFSDSFIKFLFDEGYGSIGNPYHFKHNIPNNEKINLLTEFDIFKVNRKGEQTEKDVYKDIRFGPTTLKKQIEKFGSFDKFLNSNPLYLTHYERNKKLVLMEGIPSDVYAEIILSYKNAKTDYNNIVFENYLKDNNLSNILLDVASAFKINRKLTADDYGW